MRHLRSRLLMMGLCYSAFLAVGTLAHAEEADLDERNGPTPCAVPYLIGSDSNATAFTGGSAECGTHPATATPFYDAAGRLARVEDTASFSCLRFTFAPKFISASQTTYKKRLANPDRWGRTIIWGPKRTSDYNARTGSLTAIHTHEDVKYNSKGQPWGYQTSYYLNDAPSFVTGDDGKMRYTGKAVHEDVSYNSKDLGERTVEVTEPVNLNDAKCFFFDGSLYATKRPDKKAANAGILSGVDKGNAGPTITVEPTRGGEKKYCLPEGCITVHEADDKLDEPSSDEDDRTLPVDLD